MAERSTIHLVSQAHRNRVCDLVMLAPDGYYATIGEPTRTLDQNRLMWPLIKDMRDQIGGIAMYSADDTKLRFLHALGQEMRFLPDLEETGMFPVGQRSSTLGKRQFAALLTLMFAWGDRHGVLWSAPSHMSREECGVVSA